MDFGAFASVKSDFCNAILIFHVYTSKTYRVKACPDSDPILLGLHRDKIESDGALVINGSPENLRKFFAIEIKMHKRTIEYRSRFGKKKIHTCYFGMIPPGSKMIQKDK